MTALRPALAAALAVGALGCGDRAGTTASASASAPAPTAATPAAAIPRGICDVASADDHSCTELWDDELAREQEPSCGGAFARSKACAREDVVGVCRLPDGSARFGYPPKTATMHEKRCRENQGKWAAGAAAPPADPDATVSCADKWEKGICEEEIVRLASRTAIAKEDCATLGGTFAPNAACSRDGAVSLCDLRGKRTLVMAKPDSVDARKRFCESKGGKLVEAAAPPGSASAAVDEDPVAPKPDVIIRKE